MSTSESWLSAQDSADLGDQHCDGVPAIDMLRASGAVAQRYGTALSVWRLTELDDKLELRRSFDGLLAMAMRLGITSDPIHVVSNVLLWMRDPLCPSCQGRGFHIMVGSPMLSDKPCKACEGTGKRPTGWGNHEKDLHAVLLQEQRQASAAIRRKLAAD